MRQVRVSAHQFSLGPFGVTPVIDPAHLGPLVALGDGGTVPIVYTGIADGRVWVEVSALNQTPDPFTALPAGWEVGEEVSIDVGGPLHLDNPISPEGGRAAYEPRVSGPRRLRVLARGRGAQFDLVDEDATEEYLLQLWPEPGPRVRITLGSDGIAL